MKTIKTNIIITGIRARVDGSLGLSLSTPELTPEAKVSFMELQNISCDCLIKPLDEPNIDLVEVKSEVNTKTQAQRIRSVLYLWWESLGKQGDFETFYKQKTENIIEQIKQKLD